MISGEILLASDQQTQTVTATARFPNGTTRTANVTVKVAVGGTTTTVRPPL